MHSLNPTPKDPSYLPGQLLFSTPLVGEGIFHKSVILLTEHDARGAHGIILNHPLAKKVGDVLNDPKLAPLHHLPVHLGGPIAREHLTFTALVWNPDDNHLQTLTRISTRQAMERLDDPHTHLGAYVGYAGWEPKQLENELTHHSWLPLPPTPSLITDPHSPPLWKNTLNASGPRYQLIARAPDLPFLN